MIHCRTICFVIVLALTWAGVTTPCSAGHFEERLQGLTTLVMTKLGERQEQGSAFFYGQVAAADPEREGPQWVAVLGTAIIFGLLHPISRTYVITAAVLGLYLGGVWLVTGTISWVFQDPSRFVATILRRMSSVVRSGVDRQSWTWSCVSPLYQPGGSVTG